MDPISALSGSLSILGLGAQIGGIVGEAETANQIAGTEVSMLQTQEQENEVRRQAMVLSNQRMQIENSRNAQAQRSRDIAAGVSQGAQFGSGLAGGEAGVSATAGQQSRNLSQGFQEANTMFNLSYTEDQQKMQLAQLQSQMSDYQGLSAIGGGIAGSAGPLSKLIGQTGIFGVGV
jgi:hypothetical protein